jgi:hypothetical protein
VLAIESQGNVQDVGTTNHTGVTGGPHPVANPSIFAQRPPIPPTPFFHGYPGAGNQMPFLYPHSYMPPIPGFGFGAPAQGSPSVTIDLTEGSQKRGPQGSVNDPPPTHEEAENNQEETSDCRIGRCQRRCGAPKKSSSLEGPLDHSPHLSSGGDAEHIQRTAKARYVFFFSFLFFLIFFPCLCNGV